MIRKSFQIVKLTAIGCYLFGGIFLLFAPLSLWMLPKLRLAPILMAVTGIAMIIMGVWYAKSARQQEP
ncbi:MAG TPA: hypothetical protein VGO11_03740 [Chthoniobacteraceae bacterium]|nr:hypothetical protein [Chthoniobacteraceae bacterium]